MDFEEEDQDEEDDDYEYDASTPNQDNVVEKIVDLLEKRNLINTINDEGNKPKVNQILSSLLKAHLKSVDGSNAPSNASSSQR